MKQQSPFLKFQKQQRRELLTAYNEFVKDVSAFQEMKQYEMFLAEIGRIYELKNPEAVYEVWANSVLGQAMFTDLVALLEMVWRANHD